MENTQSVSSDSPISATPSTPKPSFLKPWRGVIVGVVGVFVLGGGVAAYFVTSSMMNAAAGIPIPNLDGTLAFRVPEASLMANATYTRDDGQIVHYVDRPSVIEKAWTERNHHILIKFTDAFGIMGELDPEVVILGRALTAYCESDVTHVNDAWYYVYTSPKFEREKEGSFPIERFRLGNCRDGLKPFEGRYTGKPNLKPNDLVYVAIPPEEVAKIESAKHGGGQSGKLRAATSLDSDSDGLLDLVENSIGSKADNFDSDLDGIGDGTEVAGGPVGTRRLTADTLLWSSSDTDEDGLRDATEIGLTVSENPKSGASTNFVADSDPLTTTKPNVADTDGGSVRDGNEDANKNGKVDDGETDPNNRDDDVSAPPPFCGNDIKEGTEECDEESPLCSDDCKILPLPGL